MGAGDAALYVSPAGSNRNTGRVVSKTKPGDTVRGGPGVCRKEIIFTGSGKKGAYLSIVEAPGTPEEI